MHAQKIPGISVKRYQGRKVEGGSESTLELLSADNFPSVRNN